jgi:hypothetical protein
MSVEINSACTDQSIQAGASHLLGKTSDSPDLANKATEPSIKVDVVYASGKKLLDGINVSLVGKVSQLLDLANEELLKDEMRNEDVAFAYTRVSNLVSENGTLLEDTATIEEGNLIEGSTVTAVVFVDELKKIEELFHELIRKKNRTLNPQWEFPSLSKHVATKEKGEAVWYPVPGMYGGFSTTLHKDDSAEVGSQWKLTCQSFCRVVEGSEQAHEITFHGGTTRTAVPYWL